MTGRAFDEMTPEQRREEFTALRKALGSQPAVAEMLGRSVGWVRHLEQGREPVSAYAIYALRYLTQ